MEDCSEYKGSGERLPTTSSSSARSASGSPASKPPAGHRASSHHPRPNVLNISQELPPPRPGEMAMTSPAFELNTPIPSQYTCDGANISPPLQWTGVPAGAAALILFVIDDETNRPNGGIRWIVGDINPRSTGVAAGQTPDGGIVGSDSQGHPGYGGICPAHGQTSRIEFTMYALRHRIPLSPGFSPSVAEQEYGAEKVNGVDVMLLGKAATTYAGYHRP
jgi:Raf kinase inhibitor-like YbhB/YbcL family protein